MTLKLPLVGDAVLRRIATIVNGILDGRQNNIGSFTLTANVTTTTVTDFRVGVDSVITLMPTTANAAAALGTTYISAVAPLTNTFTVTHANAATTDRTFKYEVTG